MPSNQTVQFRGLETVLKAYENRNLPAWSLWVGQQFLFKYEGSTVDEAVLQLNEVLEMILKDGSTAIYTLKVYEDLPAGGKIKEKTPADGSFNFRLQEDSREYVRGNGNSYNSQIATLEARIKELEAENEEEEDESGLGAINEALEHPLIEKLLSSVFGINLATAQHHVPGPTISGINDADRETKINRAVAILKQHDIRLDEHLTILADTAVNSPQTFSYLLGMVDQLKK
jgi:hypothetical protein